MITERIKEQLKLNGMKWEELAEKADIPVDTMRNIYYGKVKDPKGSTLLAIADVFHVSINYLMGKNFISDDEKELLQYYRECGAHGKSMMHLVAKYEAAMAKTERAGRKHKIPCMIPLGHIVDGLEFSSSETVEIETNNPKAFFAVQIATNNNLPTYCKGDIILLQDRFPENGERAIFSKGNYIYLRQFFEQEGKYILKPVGKNGETIIVKRMDEVDCMGTCVDVIRI